MNYLDYRNTSKSYVRDPRLGHRLGRNSPGGFVSDPDWDLTWLGTSSRGFYGQGERVDLNCEADSILVLGGSAAMGLGVSERDDLLGAQLELELNRQGESFMVVNAAVGGHASWQTLLYYITELSEFNFKHVICLDGHNDFAHSSWGNKYSKGYWLPNTNRSFDDALIATQVLFKSISLPGRASLRWKSTRIGAHLARFRRAIRRESRVLGRPGWGMEWDSNEQWSFKPESIDWYLRNIALLRACTESMGARFWHFVQPSLTWQNEHRQLTEWEYRSLEKLRNRMPKIIELAPVWYKSLCSQYVRQFGPKEEISNVFIQSAEPYYHDYVHWNKLGQSLIAKELANRILLT